MKEKRIFIQGIVGIIGIIIIGMVVVSTVAYSGVKLWVWDIVWLWGFFGY